MPSLITNVSSLQVGTEYWFDSENHILPERPVVVCGRDQIVNSLLSEGDKASETAGALQVFTQLGGHRSEQTAWS